MYFRFYFVLLLCCVSRSFSDDYIEKISNVEWICANENCSEPIAIARPKQSYVADHKIKVGFTSDQTVNIYGKPTNKEDVWLVKVGKKAGVTPHFFLKENKILVKPANCIKSKIDLHSFMQESNAEIPAPKITPSRTHEVIDGTTIQIGENYDDLDDADVTVATEESKEDSGDSSGILGVSAQAERIALNVDDAPETPLDVASDASQTFKEDSTSSGSKTPDLELIPNIENLTDPQNVKTPPGDQQVPLSPVEGDSVKEGSSPSKIDHSPESEKVLHENYETNKDPSPPQEIYETNHNEQEKETSRKDPLPPEVDSKNVSSDTDLKNVNSFNTDLNEPVEVNSSESSGNTHKSLQEKPTTYNSPQSPDIDKGKTGTTQSPDIDKGKTDTTQSPDIDKGKNNENIEGKTETPSESSSTLPPSSEKPAEYSGSIPFDEYSNLGYMGYSFSNPLSSSKNIHKTDHPEPPSASLSIEQEPLNNASETDVKVSSTENEGATSLPVKGVTPSSESRDSKVSPDNQDQDVTLMPNTQDVPSWLDTQNVTPSPDTLPGSPSQDDQNKAYSDTEGIISLPESSDTTPLTTAENRVSLPDAVNVTPSPATLNVTPLPLTQDSSSPSNPQDATSSPDIQESTPVPDSQESTPLPYIQDSTPLPDTQSEGSPPESSTVPETLPADHLSSPEHFTQENKESPADNVSTPEDVLESGTDWFSPISSVIKSLKDMFTNSDIGVDDTETIKAFTTEGYSSILQPRKEIPNEYEDTNQSCDKDGFCDVPPANSEEAGAFYSIPGFDGAGVSGASLIYVTITSLIVLLFSLGYYYIENLRRDTELIAKVNSLSAELFFAQKELSTMEEKISQTSENFQKLASNTTVNEEELFKLRKDLEESKAVNNGLELEIKRMEKEIEELVESNDEMHKMLTESITEEDRTQSLLANIADLKSVLSERLEEIAALTHQLDQEKQQVELLTIALQKTEEQKEHVEEKLQKVQNEIESKALAVTKEFEEKVTSLEKIIEESSRQRTNFEKELCELKAECEKLSAEKELSEKALKKAQGIGPGKALAEWLDTKEVRVELVTAQKEVEKLRRELEEAKEHEAKLQEQKNELQAEIETLNNNYETAEKTKIETLTKLQVLSNYFKEKETQLQEELGEKEAQWLQKQSEDHTIYEQMRSLREENLSYKAQNEALKKEILDQEASFKIQIANEEQKSQENWVTLRHTERRLKEAQMEAAHLRSRLTALETNTDSLDDKHKSLEMVNGEVGLVGPGSPPFMLYPPPHDFIPPPPLVSPSRPPPLGRLSSPPLTPPPPLSPYDLYPPPPTAPSPPTIRGPPLHKPHPRDPTHQRKQKESQSSNHSSESMEKPVRRGKR